MSNGKIEALKPCLIADSDGRHVYPYDGTREGLINALNEAMFGGDAEPRHEDELAGYADTLSESGEYDLEDGRMYLGKIYTRALTAPPPAEKSAALPEFEGLFYKDEISGNMYFCFVEDRDCTNEYETIRAAIIASSHAPEVVSVEELSAVLYEEFSWEDDGENCDDIAKTILKRYKNGLKISAPGEKEKS